MAVEKQQDLIDAIVADHRDVAALLDELEASGDARNRRSLVERVITELVRHAVVEEQYLYPAARRALPDGDEMADHQLAGHAAAEQVMKKLSRTDPTTPAFDDLVGSLAASVRHHIQDAESDLLPRLRSACEGVELRELGLKYEQGKKLAPTRPHPAVPDHPPANKVLGPGVALVDRIRDALTGRGR
ncbi:MAG: hemerythrin domain-containing protein [Actinophytocola sp.]|uniref:hemerythrin domain-containing protein n=1 Tax=Actinophytocola sp. TaxID=1872138 RepID=UPI003D6AABAF